MHTSSIDLAREGVISLEEDLRHIESDLQIPNSIYYGTFGWSSDNRMKYVIVKAPTIEDARKVMFTVYGNKWSNVYPDNQFEMAIERFNLELLEIWTWW